MVLKTDRVEVSVSLHPLSAARAIGVLRQASYTIGLLGVFLRFGPWESLSGAMGQRVRVEASAQLCPETRRLALL